MLKSVCWFYFFYFYREPLPTVFSMLHPLDEIAPAVCKPTGTLHSNRPHLISDPLPHVLHSAVCLLLPSVLGTRVQYASDATMTVVFTCCQPSLVVFYDTVQGIHSVWALRKVTSEVRVQGCHVENSNERSCLMSSQHSVPCCHQERSAVLPHPADPVGMPLGLVAPGFMTSHLRKISCPESTVGTGAYGLGSGTGSGCVVSPSACPFPNVITLAWNISCLFFGWLLFRCGFFFGLQCSSQPSDPPGNFVARTSLPCALADIQHGRSQVTTNCFIKAYSSDVIVQAWSSK